MADDFNPYQRWLSIPPEEQPADHYRLLGLKRFESNSHVIDDAADRQMDHLRRMGIGPQAKLAEKLLAEVAAARDCLLVAEKKSAYDANLKAKLSKVSSGTGAKVPGATAQAARKAIPVARPLPDRAVVTGPVAAPLAAPESAMVPLVTDNNATAPKLAKQKKSPWPLVGVVAGGIVAVAIGLVLLLAQGTGPDVAKRQGTKRPTESPPQASSVVPSLATSIEKTISSQAVPAPSTNGNAIPRPETPVVSPAKLIEPPLPPPPAVSDTKPQVVPVDVPTTNPAPPLSPPSTVAAKKDERFAVPEDADRQQAELQIREVFADRLKTAKTADDRLALSRSLVEQGLDSNNAPAVRYAALMLARSFAADAGDVSQALAAVAITAEHFAIRVAKEKANVLTGMSEKGPANVRAQVLAVAQHEFDELMQSDSYPEAMEIGRATVAIAKAARDKDALDRITESAKLLHQRQQAYSEFQEAQTQLKDNSADPRANLVTGRWWWFVKNDVTLGMKHLALSGDNGFGVAAADLAGPQSSQEQREVADQWRILAGQEEGAARKALLGRARFWYKQAVTSAGGLEKARIEKYLADLNQQLGTEKPKQVASAADAPSSTSKAPAKEPKPNDSAKGDWKPPQRNANAFFRSCLGVYMYALDKKKTYPIVNLSVPNKNLWTQQVKDKCRGRITFDEISYMGVANIAIPANGVYVLTTTDAKFSINDIPTGGSGELTMVKGLHRVTFEVGVYGMVGATVSLRHKETGEEVVFFNSWKDIQQYLSTPINGQRVLEVSDWKPNEADEVKVDLKSMKVTAGGK